MPVRIWSRSMVMDALPKTYHQPIGPAASRGMGCSSIGSRVARTFNRASNQLPAANSQRFMTGSPHVGPASRAGPAWLAGPTSRPALQGVLQGRVVRRLDLEYVEPADARDAVDAAEEAARRRAGGALAVGVVDAAVARAHEQAGLLEPLHRAAQVGAVDGQDQELVGLRLVGLLLVAALVAHEDAGMSHHAVPRLADGIV